MSAGRLLKPPHDTTPAVVNERLRPFKSKENKELARVRMYIFGKSTLVSDPLSLIMIDVYSLDCIV